MKAVNRGGHDSNEAIQSRLHLWGIRKYPCVPDVTTIQFLRAWIHPQYEVHDVTFQDTAGQVWYMTHILYKAENGFWHVGSSVGGPESKEPPTQESRPCVRMGGGRGLGWRLTSRGGERTKDFFAYGQVFSGDLDIGRVRLVSQNGIILEDIVKDGLVLFWTDKQVMLPMQAELYDRAGELVSSQTVL